MAHLQSAFDTAIGYFNSGDYKQLKHLFHPNIVFKRVDDAGSVVGIGNVIEYLDSLQRKYNPQLEHLDKDQDKPVERGDVGWISGTGNYYDKKGGESITVRYTFTFALDKKDDQWLLVNAFAAPT